MIKTKKILIIEYIVIFVGLFATFLFSLPTGDMFFFSKDYEATLPSFFENALNYGNGRFLGNFIGFAFANYYTFSFIVVVIVLILVIYLINRCFFNNDYRSVLPIAIAITFPYTEFVSEVYLEFATFANYVFPVLFILLSLCILKSYNRSKLKLLNVIFVTVFTAASCLFSENTSIVVFTISVLIAVYEFIYKKKISLCTIFNFIGAVSGCLIMYLIPKLTGTSGNLDSYRGFSSNIIKSAISAFTSFSDIFSKFIIPIVLVSATMIFILIKESDKAKSKRNILIIYLAFYAVESILYTMFSDSSLRSIYFASIQMVVTALYFIAIFISILFIKKSKFKTKLFFAYLVLLSSIAPLMVVNMYGYRTFYLTYIVFLCFFMMEFVHVFPALKEIIPHSIVTKTTVKSFICVLSMAFIILSGNLFIQSVYNYDFYVVRTHYIVEKISDEQAEEIIIPILPCYSISNEDEYPNFSTYLLYKQKHNDSVIISEITSCENATEYNSVLSNNFISNTIFALQHLEYKHSSIIDESL